MKITKERLKPYDHIQQKVSTVVSMYFTHKLTNKREVITAFHFSRVERGFTGFPLSACKLTHMMYQKL